jgi:hypothetical protein
MWLTSKTVRAVLKDRKLKKILLSDKSLTEEDYLSFDTLDDHRRDTVSENVIDALTTAAFVFAYPSPVEQFPDDATVYGTRGVYMVITQDDTEFFSRKKDAIRFAESISTVSWEIASQEGLI